jgi:hypothetical protein
MDSLLATTLAFCSADLSRPAVWVRGARCVLVGRQLSPGRHQLQTNRPRIFSHTRTRSNPPYSVIASCRVRCASVGVRAQGGGVSRKLAAFGHRAYWRAVAGPPFKFNGQIRSYFIQAEEVLWDYLPLRKNGVMGTPLQEEEMVFFKRAPDGTKFKKCLYFGYTDATFRTKTPVEGDYMGVVGPVIRATVRLLQAFVLRSLAIRTMCCGP